MSPGRALLEVLPLSDGFMDTDCGSKQQPLLHSHWTVLLSNCPKQWPFKLLIGKRWYSFSFLYCELLVRMTLVFLGHWRNALFFLLDWSYAKTHKKCWMMNMLKCLGGCNWLETKKKSLIKRLKIDLERQKQSCRWMRCNKIQEVMGQANHYKEDPVKCSYFIYLLLL